MSNVPPPCKRSEVGHRAIFDLISNCSDSESRGNSAILARGAGNPAFVRAKVKRFICASLMREQHSERLPDKGLTGSCPNCEAEATRCSKCFEKSYRAAKAAPIEPDLISRSRQAWNMGDMFPGTGKQKTAESMSGTTWLSSQPVRILRDQEEHRGKRRHRDFQP